MVFRDKAKDGTTRLTGGSIVSSVLDVYPIGSIYMSVSATNPATFFGGTWAAWGSGRMPVGVDAGQSEFNTVEETGGTKTHTLVSGNLPPHTHNMDHDHNTQYANADGSSINTIRTGASTDPSFDSGNTNQVLAHNGSTGNGPGSSDPVTHLPPYITCYMWKRTA